MQGMIEGKVRPFVIKKVVEAIGSEVRLSLTLLGAG
jgi:hypothetical protein